MRVAVHLPDDHPDGGGVVAYKLGRIRDGIDNHVVHTGEMTPLDEFAAGLVEQAKRDYPQDGVKVVVERLVDNGDGTAKWIPADDFDPEQHRSPEAGGGAAREFNVESKVEAR